MNYKSKLLILGLISKIYAASFSVVSFNGDCKLNINGQQYEMTRSDPNVPLYKTEVDVPINTTYKYVCGGVEDVERTLKETTTHNELVGRSLTIHDMPEFGFPNKKPWTRSIGRTELFDPDYVPIVIVEGGDADFYTYANKKDRTTFSKMTFILKDNVFTFNNVSATGKNYEEDKFQFRVELPNGGIYNRNVLKFRPSSFDPVFFRQMLYGDIAHAIGNPAHESIAARVYLGDGTGFGLYVLQEDCTTESFINSAFYGKQDGSIEPHQMSPIYDCSTGADFNVNDENWLGDFQSFEGDQKNELLEMTRQIDQLDVMNDEAIKNLDENWLELDTLFRALALEYLAGHWDSYWFLTTNFVVYHPAEETEGTEWNYSKYKYYFIDQDFDQTWGSNMKATFEVNAYPTRQYDYYINRPVEYWKTINADEINSEGKLLEKGTRVILNKLIGCDGKETCSTKTYFENHLKNIVQHIFNPVAIGRKINEGYKIRLDEEIKWDTQLNRLHVSERSKFHFTYDDFITNIDQGVGAFPYGIMDWTSKMADLVCNQFQIEYDSEALTPETAENFEAQNIEPGADYDDNKLNSASFMNTINIAMVTIVTILSVVLLF